MIKLKNKTAFAPLLVAVGYVVIGLLSSRLVQTLYGGGLLWVPGGFALAVAILYGRRALLGVVPGGFALAMLLGFAPLPALIVGVASLAGTWLGASVAPKSWRHRPALRSLGDARALWRVALTTSAATAVLVALGTSMPKDGLASARVHAGEFLLADVLGILLLLPVMLAVLGPKDRSERTGSVPEFVAVLSLLVMGTVLNYAVDLPISVERAIPYLLGPLLILLVLRFGWREVSFAVLLMTPVAFVSASRGVGPFAGDDIVQARLMLQLAFIGATMMSQVVVVLMGERRGIVEELESSHRELEERVEARTAELVTSNRVLAAEMLERRMIEEELHGHRASLERIVHERTAELEEANRQLTSAMRAKGQFLANMSHELRTPLNSIIGFSDVLVRGMAGELTDEQSRQVAMVNSSGKHLLALVNDVLDITKIEASAVRIAPEHVDLAPVVAQVLESMRPLANAKGLTLGTGVPDGVFVYTDKTKLQQILINLVGNAIKFTHVGGVHITVDAEDETVLLRVNDTGIGIAPDEIEDIFDEFHQSRSVEVGKPVGTGLGLAISRRLARMLGGDLVVSSQPGVGSTFTLTLQVVCTESVERASAGVSLS